MTAYANSINYLIGDVSLDHHHSYPADDKTHDTRKLTSIELIQIHLEYAEHRLRRKDISHLSESQTSNRSKAIQVLRRYRLNGIFPKHDDNYLFSEARRPRFIDHRNVHCAVGHMIKETVGETLAKDINSQFEYAYVHEMEYQPLRDWATVHGLDIDECRMIQPQYLPEINCPIFMSLTEQGHTEKLAILRQYRDNQLTRSLIGRIVIRTYYLSCHVTGPLARRSPQFRRTLSRLLTPIVDNVETK
ncbi:hypothetical protein A9Q99_19065 [Gammaproteobacteria bacterium 45_16_T64]|nr:hypothetical protein A9Q99_19065 [Gammaproteobacteria bacterium 45_16_T64]